MKKRICINCYTIDNSNISPGIPASLLNHIHTSFDFIVLPQTPVCRFAVEDKFNEILSAADKHWLVNSEENELSYYRFFEKKDDEVVYLLLYYEDKNLLPKFLFNNAIVNEPGKILTKISYNRYFSIGKHKIIVTDTTIHMPPL